MKTYYQKLMEIKKRPGMYLGYPSITSLFHFMYGYMICAIDIGEEVDKAEFEGFQEWIEYKYFGKKCSHNWASIIKFYYPLEDEAFYQFYDLLQEYVDSKKK